MKKLLFTIFASMAAVVAYAQVPTTPTTVSPAPVLAAPVIETPQVVAGGGVFKFIDASGKYDFGSVEDGMKVTHDYVFTNEGTEPIIISNVKASCGCTTPSWPKEPIAPGASAKITATFNSKGRVGTVNKAITISSNASTPSMQLFLLGKVTAAPVPALAPEKAPSMLSEPKN